MKSSPCEARSSYLGFVAHEFRNPLATALWCAQLLGRLDPAERAGARGQKLAATAQRAMARVGRLLEDHFLAERLEAGGLPIRLEQVELLPAARAAGEAAAPPGGTTFAALEGVAVAADRQLLMRILESAIAAAGRDGAPVKVEANAGAGGVEVLVRGAPLPPDALEQPRKGAPSDATGRALGLFTARAAAGALGAALAVHEGALRLAFPGKGG